MLDGLDEINWSSLRNAYGCAEDVPALLRARASRDPDEAEAAESELFGNIVHQGTVYDATAYAVPFLVELLIRPETHSRVGLVVLLEAIAEGTSYIEVHQHLPRIDLTSRRDFHENLATELSWKDRARKAVGEHANYYWPLLDEPILQISIPSLLSKLPEERERILSHYPSMLLAASGDLFKSSLLMGLAFTKGWASGFSPYFQCDVPLIRIAAALGTLLCESDVSLIHRALEIYFEALRAPEKFRPTEEEGLCWVWGLGDLYPVLIGSFNQFSGMTIRALKARLPEVLPSLGDWEAGDLAAEALRLGFDAANLPRSKNELNELQRALLTGLSRAENVSHSDPLIHGIQTAFGLSCEMEELANYLRAP